MSSSTGVLRVCRYGKLVNKKETIAQKYCYELKYTSGVYFSRPPEETVLFCFLAHVACSRVYRRRIVLTRQHVHYVPNDRAKTIFQIVCSTHAGEFALTIFTASTTRYTAVDDTFMEFTTFVRVAVMTWRRFNCGCP